MTDRELLTLAAKAAGINYHHIDDKGVWWRTNHMSESVYCWNPLVDDADAARLEASLLLSVEWDANGVTVGGTITSDGDVVGGEYESFFRNMNEQAARRRATVSAAAELGKKMP